MVDQAVQMDGSVALLSPSFGQMHQRERSTPDALLLRSAAGDVDAFAQFYDLVSPRLFSLLGALTKDPKRCEDQLRDVMLEIWRTCPQYDGRVPAEKWAMNLTFRRCGRT